MTRAEYATERDSETGRFNLWRLSADGIWDVVADFATRREASEAMRRAIGCEADPLAVLESASRALRCYQYGNSLPDMARDIADACDAVLAVVGSR